LGLLPGGDGEVPIKNRNKIEHISPNMFRCFEGAVPEYIILDILSKVEDSRCLLKKNESNKGDIPSIEDLAKTWKFFYALQPKIVSFLTDKYDTHFPERSDWDDVVKILPELADKKEMNRIRIICGPKYESSLAGKNRKAMPFPPNLASRLNQLVGGHFQMFLRERKTPFCVIETPDLCLNTIPSDISDETP